MASSHTTVVADLVEKHMARLAGENTLSDEISYFQEQLEKDSLSRRVEDAIASRKQGHFDRAMLGISEVNRDQVMAARKIQALLSKVDGEPYPIPVFEKFRQQEPFEIGLSEASPTLKLLGEFNFQNNAEICDAISLFHELEGNIRDESDYIEFLKKKGADAIEIEKAKADRDDLLIEADKARAAILITIFENIKFRTKTLMSSRGNALLFLELGQNIFQVVTSSTATKHSIDVEAS